MNFLSKLGVRCKCRYGFSTLWLGIMNEIRPYLSRWECAGTTNCEASGSHFHDGLGPRAEHCLLRCSAWSSSSPLGYTTYLLKNMIHFQLLHAASTTKGNIFFSCKWLLKTYSHFSLHLYDVENLSLLDSGGSASLVLLTWTGFLWI